LSIAKERGSSSTHANGSTNVKTFTSPDDLDLFDLSTAFGVCDVGQVNIVISKLLA
jgi:hypothetical protein